MDARPWVWSFDRGYEERRDYAWEELHGCVLCRDTGCVFCEESAHPVQKIPLRLVETATVKPQLAEDVQETLARIRAFAEASKEREKEIEDRYFTANKNYIIQQLTYETDSRNHGRVHPRG